MPFALTTMRSMAESCPPTVLTGSKFRPIAWHVLIWLVTLAVIASALSPGLRLRRWTWDKSEDIHFFIDINRGYDWGYKGSGDEGYLNLYEKMAHQQPAWPLWLDYAPLRLGVMTTWARTHPSDAKKWQNTYDFNWPVLCFNTGMELLAAGAAFFVVRRMLILARRPAPVLSWPAELCKRMLGQPVPCEPFERHPPFTGWFAGMLAALLLWFNPAMILNGHAYPTWDIWLIPMFLLALLAALYERWTLAGIAIGLGAMFKGQLFFGLPIFLAWTLLNGNWRGGLRFACGVLVSVGVVATPWMVTYIEASKLAELYAAQEKVRSSYDFAPFIAKRLWNWPAIAWVCGVFLSAAVLPWATRRPSMWVRVVSCVLAAALVMWPAVHRFEWQTALVLLAGYGAIFLAAFSNFRWGDHVLSVATATAIALFACMYYFGASNAWWDCGIKFGTRHWQEMVTGLTDNLPGLLKTRYRWDQVSDLALVLSPGDLFGLIKTERLYSIGQLLRGLMVLFMVPCLWAVARQARRRDPRLLVAVAAPWLMFFTFSPQIHERYLIYVAAIGMIWIGQSVGMAALAMLLSVATWMQVTHVLLDFNRNGRGPFGEKLHAWQPTWFEPSAGNTLYRLLEATHPDLAWAILVAVLVVLWVSIGTTPRDKRIALSDLPADDRDDLIVPARAITEPAAILPALQP
ncbi:MAG: hypothetical protein JWM57_2802 [Phycisphaerales bacterium]|nr:hypothetical protein [Phycisphaerales bacterium]